MSFKETFTISGEDLIKKIKELIADGNVSKVNISDKDGTEIISFPVTVGVVGVIIAPILAAVGAVAALLTECTITVERKKGSSDESADESKDENQTAD